MNGDDDSDEDDSSNEDQDGSDDDGSDPGKFADPDDVDMDVDEDDEDIDSEVAFGDSDIERFKDFSFRGSSKIQSTNGFKKRPTASDFMSDSEEIDEDMLDANGQHAEDVEEDYAEDDDGKENGGSSDHGSASSDGEQDDDEDTDGEQTNVESEDGDAEKERRAELRKIMNEEQKTVVATISQAAKADADKGNAVKQQRKAFDSLLSVRIVLQKSLIATNSMAVVERNEAEDAFEAPYQAAEDAALKLWNTLDGLRHELIKASGTSNGKKRKRDVDSSTPSSKIWERMQASEVASIDNRQRTLEKWWGKVRGSIAPLTGKFKTVAPMSLTSVIQEQLAKPETTQKTKRPRSCAPVQEKSKVIEDTNIYDDTTLYKVLLNQLVEQRKVDSISAVGGGTAPAQWAVKEAKMRKVVDTKASKGRKMRFTVHEKLQNFMAPEDRGSWEQPAVDRFFGTLLGQKMTLGEDGVEVDEDEEYAVLVEEEGLKLFRS